MTPTPDGQGYRFRLSELHVGPLQHAFWCPTTRRIVDTTFRGYSPYDEGKRHPKATPIEMPRLPFFWGMNGEGTKVSNEELDEWLALDTNVLQLRDMGAWGDQQERAARFSPWLRAAEHSA